MKHVNEKDATDIRNWLYQGWGERIKISLVILVVGFIIMTFLFSREFPKDLPFIIGMAILLAPSIIGIVAFNKSLNKHNKEVIKFKRMTKEEQDEYIQTRDSNFKR